MPNRFLVFVAVVVIAACGSPLDTTTRDARADGRVDGRVGTRDGGAVDAGEEDVPEAPFDAGREEHAPPFDAGDTDAGGDLDAATPPDGAVADGADTGVRLCPDPPACNAPAPPRVAMQSWRHSVASRWTVSMGSPHHRGRDLYLRASDPQWALAKFAYGWSDDDLKDEDVEVYLLRGCSGAWEHLGTARTTADDGMHATVEGVEDSGGRVYFRIPESRRLGVGWHRLHFIVRGDLSTTDQYIRVLPAGARVVVTDVDGTLTESETAEFRAVFGGASPNANPGAADVMWTLARRGYEIFYLTARPEWLASRTHEWMVERGFPMGIVHTTLGLTGAMGSSAQTFKTDEIRALSTRLGAPPDYAFGNTDTDAGAYSASGIAPSRSYYYQFTGDRRGGVLNNDYRTLVAPLSMVAPMCR